MPFIAAAITIKPSLLWNLPRPSWRVPSRLAIMLIATLLSATPSWAETRTTVDRNTVFANDSLTLTIHADGIGLTSPNLQPLETDFYILGSQQSSQQRISNGQSEAFTEWYVTLIPKRQGQLTIPAITVADDSSAPLTIDVKPAQERPDHDILPVFIESEISEHSVYIQQQILYTVRIFQAVQLSTPSLSQLSVPDASVQVLSQNSFTREIDHINYRVNEIRYAIFPHNSGSLTIPPVVFSALQPSSHTTVFGFNRLQNSGTPIKQITQEHTIEVMPPPSHFTGTIWLPATAIDREMQWSGDINHWHVGESLTLTIITTAQNLMPSQLPPVDFVPLQNAQHYVDQAVIESAENAQGILAKRIDSVAIIPTAEGPLTLPSIRLSWWDTMTHTPQETVIPATTITIKPAITHSMTTPTHDDPTRIDSHTTGFATANEPFTSQQSNIPWAWVTTSGTLLLLWLITLGFYIKSRYQQTPRTRFDPTNEPPTHASESQAFYQLKQACEDNNAAEARSAMIQWAAYYWPNASIHNLESIGMQCGDSLLTDSLLALDAHLYGQSAHSHWQGKPLLTAIMQLRRQPHKPIKTASSLPPLYKSLSG